MCILGVKMVGREQIDQIRAGVDIVEVIREYVPSLKSAGRSVKGLCPFHSEKSPSFYVHAEKGLYKCFGCGEAGDVFAFIVKMEQVGFADALQMLADKAGIRLEKRDADAKPEPEGQREKLFRVLEAARSWYEQQLWDERIGEDARKYLDERGIREETSRWFRLGFAATGGNAAFEHLVKRGFSIELCHTAGLAARSASGRYYDPMFGRLVFPILDGFGHVIGFGGRVLPAGKKPLLGGDSSDEGPKYLNSPDSPVFSKGRSLYGLFQAKTNILSSRRVIVLEGYMDVIGVHQGGIQNAVATLGTAFTRDHAKMLRRYADEAVAFFDPDEAGKRAAMRSIEPMLQEGFFARVLITKESSDPDELIREKGREHVDGLVESAPDFVDFALQTLKAESGEGLQQRSAVAQQLVALISQSPNEIMKSEWLARVAKELNLRVESLEREFQRRAPGDAKPAFLQRPSPAQRRPMPTAEEEYFQVVINCPEIASLSLVPDDFTAPRERLLMERLLEQKAERKISIASIYEEFEGADREWVLSLSTEEREFGEPATRETQLAGSIRLKRMRERMDGLSEKIRQGIANSAEMNEHKDLLRRVKGSARA